MINSFINAVKLYWENLKPKQESYEIKFWEAIYTCINKQIENNIKNNKCPYCNNKINYDINKYKYCYNCGQKLKKDSGE